MIVRPAVEDYIEGLIELQAQAIAIGYPSEIRDTLVGNPSIAANDLRRRWSAKESFIVAEDDGAARGFAILAEQDNDLELYGIFVHPAFWRQGIGSDLVTAAAQAAAVMGRTRMFVRANPLATEFYKVNGFAWIDVVASGAMTVPLMVRQIP